MGVLQVQFSGLFISFKQEAKEGRDSEHKYKISQGIIH